jgi:hypothetical protein
MWLAMTCIAQLLLIEGEEAPQSNRFSNLYLELFRPSPQGK